MATYTKACSQVGSFSYAKYFTLYVVLEEQSVSTSANTSKVKYTVYCQSSGSGSISANHDLYFKLNGSTIVNKNVYVNVSSPNAYIAIASGTTGAITHNSDGSKSVSFSASISATGGYGVSASLSDTFTLTTIPRYASFNGHRLDKAYLTSLDIAYNSNKTLVAVQYSLNSGTWKNASIKSGTWNQPNNTVVYTISGLSPNTSYTVRTRIAHVSGLWTTSDTLSLKTLDIAKISSVANFEHGNNTSVSITNPASISSLSLVMKIGSTQILSRTVKAGANTITFSDTELDNLYKKYGSSSSLTATFTLTGSGYTNSKTCTVTLKGNQKTIKSNISSSWKRGKLWTNVDGVWKRAVVWINVDGTWKRSI